MSEKLKNASSEWLGGEENIKLPVEEKILTGLEQVHGDQQKILADYDRLDGESKKAFEGLTKARDDMSTVKGSLNDFHVALTKLQKQLAQENASHFRESRANADPIARISEHEPSRDYLNGLLRQRLGLPMTPAQKTAVTSADSGLGAAVTPQETSDMIYDALLSYGQWNTLGVIPVGSTTQVLPLTTARPTAYWIAGGAQITEGAITGSSVTLTIKDAAAWIPVANSLLEDSTVDMSGYLIQQLAEAVAYRLDWACFAADGTDDTTDGAYTGITEGGTAATAATGNTTVSLLDLDDFVRCLTTVDAAVLQRPAAWWMHPTVLAKVCLVRDGNGRPIFQTANEAPMGAIGSILGYPVRLTGAMPSTDSAGNVVAAFGDPRAGAVGLRRSVNFASSTDFQFDYNRTAFRVITRAGFKVRSATSFAALTLASS